AVRSTLAAEAPAAYVRQMIEEDDRGFTDELWTRMADLGWLGVLVPEAHGGLGLGLVDLVVIQDEMGKLPFPGPYLSSAVLATLAAVRLGALDLPSDRAAGTRRGASAPSTWPSITPRCGCSSTGPSPPSRPSSTRRPRCCTSSS